MGLELQNSFKEQILELRTEFTPFSFISFRETKSKKLRDIITSFHIAWEGQKAKIFAIIKCFVLFLLHK